MTVREDAQWSLVVPTSMGVRITPENRAPVHTADRFCDLAGFHPDRLEPVVYAHDGSCCTLIEVDGTRTIVSDEEFEEAAILRIAGSLAQILKRPGHNLSISFESSLNTHADIETLATAQLRSADQKGLSLEAIVEEGRVVLERRARRERILVAVWTRPDAAGQGASVPPGRQIPGRVD